MDSHTGGLGQILTRLRESPSSHFFLTLAEWSTLGQENLGIRKTLSHFGKFASLRKTQPVFHLQVPIVQFISFAKQFMRKNQALSGIELCVALRDALLQDEWLAMLHSELTHGAGGTIVLWLKGETIGELRKVSQTPDAKLVYGLLRKNLRVTESGVSFCAGRVYEPKDQVEVRQLAQQQLCDAVTGLTCFHKRDGLHKKHTITQVEAKMLATAGIMVFIDMHFVLEYESQLQSITDTRIQALWTLWVLTQLNRMRLVRKLAHKYDFVAVCFTQQVVGQTSGTITVDQLTRVL